MKLTYDRLREITERAENAIDEETYLRPELEEVLEEMTECWAEIERLKEENTRLGRLYEREREIADRLKNTLYGVSKLAEGRYHRLEAAESDIERMKEENERQSQKLQDALNTLKWYADSSQYEITHDLGYKAMEAIDRMQEEETES